MRNKLILLSVAVAAAGCAPMRYSEFSGRQNWTTTPGAMADNGYAVAVYRGWPEKPYQVIGSIQFANANAYWDDGDTARAARLAKSRGGDAIIMRHGAEFGVGAIVGAAADPRVFSVGQIAALVIKWKTDSEVLAEQARFQRFLDEFRRRHPDLPLKKDVVGLASEVVQFMGMDLDSPAGIAKVDEIASEVVRGTETGKPSQWLFRGTLRSSALASSFTSEVFGVATVTQTANSVTIVSSAGRPDLNFSGTSKDGRLTGHIGVSEGSRMFSGQAEGVVTTDRISLSSQAQTADGLMQSIFTFVR